MSKTPSRKNMIIISDDKSIHMANRGHSSCNKKPNTNSPIQVLMEQPVIDMKQYDSLSSNSPPQKKKILGQNLIIFKQSLTLSAFSISLPLPTSSEYVGAFMPPI
jgi:hypothetical protein